MTLSALLRESKNNNVIVRDALSGDCLFQGSDNLILHSAKCDDFIVESYSAAYQSSEPVLYVEVI